MLGFDIDNFEGQGWFPMNACNSFAKLGCYEGAQVGRLNTYWGNLPKSMFTLFKSICGGLSWHDGVHPMAEVSALRDVSLFLLDTFPRKSRYVASFKHSVLTDRELL